MNRPPTCDEPGCFEVSIDGSAKCGGHDPERLRVLLEERTARRENSRPPEVTPNPLLMEEIPQTLGELNGRIAKLFHCMNGPPMAYFGIPLRYNVLEAVNEVEHLVYVTLAWRAPGRRSPDTDARLIMTMLEPFLLARQQIDERGGTPLLFWRRTIELDEYSQTDFEGNETGGRMTRITCRLVIPGADLSGFAHREGELIKTL